MEINDPKVIKLQGRSIFNNIESAKVMSKVFGSKKLHSANNSVEKILRAIPKVITSKKFRSANSSVENIHKPMAIDTKNLST